jgi:hypothetical protein
MFWKRLPVGRFGECDALAIDAFLSVDPVSFSEFDELPLGRTFQPLYSPTDLVASNQEGRV